LSLRLIPIALAFSTLLGAGVSSRAADFTRSAMVVCTIKKWGDPWSLIAHGELVRTISGTRTEYQLEVGEHTFSYSVVSNSDGSTTMSLPSSLVRALVEKSSGHTTPRGPIIVPLYGDPENATSLPSYTLGADTDGNVREYATLPNLGRIVLITVAGSGCPRAGEGLRPNPAVERDARKSRARPSP
jgi:hypothetical protein